MKVGDIVIIEKQRKSSDATLYRILSIENETAEIAVVKYDGNDVPDGITNLSGLCLPTNKQREYYKGKDLTWTES